MVVSVVVSARVVMSRMCAFARPRVRDGKPAEVVCGYFGDWFYRVGNGARAAPARATLLFLLPSLFLFLFGTGSHVCVNVHTNLPDISPDRLSFQAQKQNWNIFILHEMLMVFSWREYVLWR